MMKSINIPAPPEHISVSSDRSAEKDNKSESKRSFIKPVLSFSSNNSSKAMLEPLTALPVKPNVLPKVASGPSLNLKSQDTKDNFNGDEKANKKNSIDITATKNEFSSPDPVKTMSGDNNSLKLP